MKIESWWRRFKDKRQERIDRAEFHKTLHPPCISYVEWDFIEWRKKKYNLCHECGRSELSHGVKLDAGEYKGFNFSMREPFPHMFLCSTGFMGPHPNCRCVESR